MSWRVIDIPLIWRTAAAVSVGKLCGAQLRPSASQDIELNAEPSRSLSSSLLSNVSFLQRSLTNLTSLTTNVTRFEGNESQTIPVPLPTSTSAATTAPDSVGKNDTSSTKTKSYDFVIVGNGTTGRSAVETLREKCPNATIALIDPLRKPLQQPRRRSRIDFVQDAVVSLDPRQRRIGMVSNGAINYKYAVLLATGSHGAPPPSYLVEEKAHTNIFELRPTGLDLGRNTCLPPIEIRTKAIQLAKKGQVIGILGSSWDAVDLAIATAAAGKRTRRPALFFGGSGPLSQTVPTYLSSAIAKRLKQKRVSIHDRTLIRYINHDDVDGSLQIYSARSYDFLDSSRTLVDHMVSHAKGTKHQIPVQILIFVYYSNTLRA